MSPGGRLRDAAVGDSAAKGQHPWIELAFPELAQPSCGVRRIRISSRSDEGLSNPYGDIALGEIQVF